MSRYGQRWEAAARVRRLLAETVPGAKTDASVVAARKSVEELLETQRRKASLLLDEWEYIERQMAKEPG